MWQRVRTALSKLLRVGSTPNRIAGGFTLGLGLSLVPIPVLGMVVALALVPVLRVNPIATYAGTAVVNPVTGAAIYFFELWVGMQVMGHPPPRWATLATLDAAGWWDLFAELLAPFALGAAVVASVTSVLSFILVRALVIRLKHSLSAGEPGGDPGSKSRNSHPQPTDPQRNA